MKVFFVIKKFLFTSHSYDSIARCMPDSFSGLLERIRQLELELGHLPQKWRVRWEQLELPNTLELQVRTDSRFKICSASRTKLEVP